MFYPGFVLKLISFPFKYFYLGNVYNISVVWCRNSDKMDGSMREKHKVEQHTAGFKQFGYNLVLDKAHSFPKQPSDKVFAVQVSCVEMMDEGKKAFI